MTLKEMQGYILSTAWWIGDWSDPKFDPNDYIREYSDLRVNLGLNDDEIRRMFLTTDLVTVKDAMDYMDKRMPEFNDLRYKDDFPFEVAESFDPFNPPKEESSTEMNFHMRASYKSRKEVKSSPNPQFSYKQRIKQFK